MGLLDNFQHSNINPHEKKILGEENNNIQTGIGIFVLVMIAGNIASGFTTFQGVNDLINNLIISLLMTFTIQGAMTLAAYVATKNVIKKKIPFLIIYIIPMLSSIFFNYVFFFGEFSKISEKQNSQYNEYIDLSESKEKLNKEFLQAKSEIDINIDAETKNKTKLKTEASRLKQLEETKYGTGGAGQGKEYYKYKAEEEMHNDAIKTLIEFKTKLAEQSKKINNSILSSKNNEELRKAHSYIIDYFSIAEVFSKGVTLPKIPYIGQGEKYTKGENQYFYEAAKALLNPKLFEWISIILAILMDFIIFSWVLLSIFFNLSVKEFINE